MESNSITSREYFKTIRIIFFALIAGLVLFGLVSLMIYDEIATNSLDPGLVKILSYIFPVIILGGFLSSQFIFKNSLKTAIEMQSLTDKMAGYRSALIIRYALLEGPAFLTNIAFLMTGNLLFLGYAVIVILVFLSMIPSVDHAVADLQLNPAEEEKVRNPEAIIG